LDWRLRRWFRAPSWSRAHVGVDGVAGVHGAHFDLAGAGMARGWASDQISAR